MRRLSILLLFTLLFTGSVSSDDPSVINGPYLQDLSGNSVTISWITDRETVSCLEIKKVDENSSEDAEYSRFYPVRNGLRTTGRIHNIKADGLAEGTRYQYRLLVSDPDIYNDTVPAVKEFNVVREENFEFKTLSLKEELNFVVMNDIHGNNELLRALWKVNGSFDPEIVFFNGDMINGMHSERQIFEGFVDTAVELFATSTPFYYTRGNHESRGPYTYRFHDYFTTPNGKPYYGFSAGPVYFIILDGGDYKHEEHTDYYGLADFTPYRLQQAEWLKREVRKEEFTGSQYKVVVTHIPPLEDQLLWYGSLEVQRLFMPVLNDAGIDLMISGHLHYHLYFPYDEELNQFPLIINSNDTVIHGTVRDKELIIVMYDRNGNKLSEWKYGSKIK